MQRTRAVILVPLLIVLGSRCAMAESWYVVKADAQAARIIDADSRRLDQDGFVTIRVVHPGFDATKKLPIIATQFSLEFDCKGNRYRTIDFALIDVDGRIPAGLESNEVHEWSAVESDAPTNDFKQLACEGRLPPKATGPYKFVDIESKYLMWLQYGAGKDFSEYMHQEQFP